MQHLQACCYAPQQTRFVIRDPFPGMLGLPATLNPYSYAVNSPVMYTDPSGEIAPILVAAGLGGLIGAGIDVGVQLYNMRPFSLGQALRCMNWGKVGISFASGAVAGLARFITFSGITAIMGTGFLANVVAGAFSGVMAGQHGRATGLLLSGQTEQITITLFRPQDMVLDAILGGVGGEIGYGIQRGLSGIAEDILQGLTDNANRRLSSNPALAQGVLSKAEYMAGQTNPSIARMQYGNAVRGWLPNKSTTLF